MYLFCDGRFGRTVLAEVAKGSRSQKVKNFGLSRATTFGCASEFTKQEIMEEIDSAIAERLISVSADLYPTVTVSERGRTLMGKTPVAMRFRYNPTVEIKFPELFEACVVVRRELASRDNMPEQAVVDDATLREIVNAMPRTTKDIATAVQTGNIFLSRFAPAFLRVIRDYIAAEKEQAGEETPLPKRIHETVKLARDGHDLRAIAEKRGLTPGTVSQHLQEAIELGVSLRREQFVHEELFAKVRDFLRSRKQAALRDIRSGLDLECDYCDLRIAVAFARADRKAAEL